MNPIESNIRKAEAKHTNFAIDEIMGNVDDAKQARANTKKAAQDVTDAWNPGGTAPAAKKPGFFSRVATGFRNLGNRISAFFGGTPAAAAPPVTQTMNAQAPTHGQSDSRSDDTEIHGLGATKRIGGLDNKMDLTSARAKMGRAVAQTEDFEPDMHDDVKKSLNVTMTRSEAMEAAKALTKAQDATHTHDTGHSL